MLLGSARQAYNERQHAVAATRFRDFLQKYGGHPNAAAARYGLALTLLEQPERDYNGAIEQLQPIAGNTALPEHPFVLYKLGLAKRGQGLQELAIGEARPNEANQRREAARQRFEEASRNFAAAAGVFTQRTKPDPDAKEPPLGLEWAARARCDQAEMELRIQKPKEARLTVESFVKDPALAKSRYQRLGRYYHGYASFLLADYPTAARSLNHQDVFADAVFGSHARYVMGRIHQQDGELAEAAAQYDAVLADYAKRKAAAVESLKRPDQFRANPDEKARLELLVKTAPEHVVSAAFFGACLQYEAGRFGDSLGRFSEFAKLYPNSPRLPEAQLRVGFCQVQLKQFPEAIATLSPIPERHARLSDQALLWLGKAQAQNFPAENAAARDQALKTAMDTLRRAADRANQLAGQGDAEARGRRAEIMLELADTQQSAKLHREAAGVYEQLLNEKSLPTRGEELLQRLAAALHLAGDLQRSDQTCDRFLQEYPQSPLRAAVLFRRAENGFFAAQALAKNANANRADLDRQFDEAAKRFQTVIDKYPEFERINVCRYSLGVVYHRKGDFEKAQQALASIPAPDRNGDLSLTGYLLADCLLRLAPAKADDAIAAGRLQEQLTQASQLLDAFSGANPQGPETADALLKLGYCHQRLAGLLAQQQEKAAALNAARAAYDKLRQTFPKNPLAAVALMERAKCQALAGDRGGAMNELRRFANELQDTPVAPLALLRLATLLREQNNPAEAVKVLADCRQKHEGRLQQDPARADQIPLLRYHHGVALLELGKIPEARGLFEQVIQQSAGKPIAAEAALRAGQCRLIDGRQRLDAARPKLGAGKPEERAAAEKAFADGLAAVRDAGKYLEDQANAFKQPLPGIEARARMWYDAAWAYRLVADEELKSTRAKLQADSQKKLLDEAMKKLPPGSKPPVVPLPEVARATIPLQPSEDKARACYRALIADFADLSISGDARLELAEQLAERAEHDPAIQILKEALDKEPPAEMTDRIRLRLGSCLFAKKDAKAALDQFAAIADPKSPSFPQAQYRVGECLIAQGDFAEAAKRLAVFRDRGEFQNHPGLTDRALLRLGFALAQLKQWDASRQAYEVLVGRFGNSPWVHDARYGIGWARQNMKQYEEAVAAYSQVTSATTTVLAAKAQIQIGLCRFEQKRFGEAASALLVVPHTYDYPELTPLALCEAARSYLEMKDKVQAERLLQRVLRDFPDGEWAKVAKERMSAIQ
jgi:TolA-binding protein